MSEFLVGAAGPKGPSPLCLPFPCCPILSNSSTIQDVLLQVNRDTLTFSKFICTNIGSNQVAANWR